MQSFLLLILLLNLAACSSINQKTIGVGAESPSTSQPESGESMVNITIATIVGDVFSDPSFKDFGRLLFPIDRTVTAEMTLAEVSTNSVYVWYSDIQPQKTVEIIHRLKSDAESGKQIFIRYIRMKKLPRILRKQIRVCFSSVERLKLPLLL